MSRKEELVDFIERAKQLLIEGKDEILRSSKIGKLLLEVASLNREKKELYRDIGEKFFNMDRTNMNIPPPFEPMFHKVEEIDQRIAKQETHIEELKKKSEEEKGKKK
ncbi:MAG: hypothetical protein HYS98_04765 [Deltaproteobacteria bacterium]|nr:hypothetical protein [Deltaproteobacteria bacterium]